MRCAITIAAVLAVLATASGVRADWNTADPHKMHFPQLPDPEGWDVAFSWTDPVQGMQMSNMLADDWVCSETGAVKDVHFWVSMQGDLEPGAPGIPVPFQIHTVDLTFYKDLPANPDENRPYSMPGERIQTYSFFQEGFTVRWDGMGPQGWYNPGTGEHVPPLGDPPDHINIYQVNIPDIPEPIMQNEGDIYWLQLEIWASDLQGLPASLGWKTADLRAYPDPFTGEHFMDDAVYMQWVWVDDGAGTGWYEQGGYQELILPPDMGISRDLAFVITPEPATVVLLGLGAVGLVARRRRKK
jgi:hypothetical protein